ncbi:MAG: ERF family protein [Megasphaera sp.]|jgi:hypothetical protein|nr:ERF family protein [Megasphaera sp.]
MKALAKKLIAVMKDCGYVMKKGENKYHGYTYATGADVLEKINTAFVQYGIASAAVPELLRLDDITTAKGNVEKLATVRMDIQLTDMESGETVQITGLGSGQDAGDKAVMKAQTAAIKYAYLLSFAISTGDDPEADCHTDEITAVPEEKTGHRHQMQSVPNRPRQTTRPPVCSVCGTVITEKVFQFSKDKYGRALCMDCQRSAKGIA